MIKKITLLLVIFFTSYFAYSATPLPADQAFSLIPTLTTNHTLNLQWHIAPGYHLYRDSIAISPLKNNRVELGTYILPQGEWQSDDIRGTYQVYDNSLAIEIPLININEEASLAILVHYQGCSASGYCYAPIDREITMSLATSSVIEQKNVLPDGSTQTEKITHLFQQYSIAWTLLIFVGIGLLLTFTPCVLPMIPILSGIILGHGHRITTRYAFFLSLTYVLAMALTYAVAGLVIALLGSQVQAVLQSPIFISIFSLIFVLLALSLFGLYELKLPSRFESKMTNLSNRQKSGSFIGVFIMGILSTLIVSPCVSAPLVGVLLYIANTGDAALGASALFSMGVGMGIPLLIVGTSARRWLPKAGLWMRVVKALFGVMLLMVALLLLGRILPNTAIMILWSLLFIIGSVFMGAFSTVKTSARKLFKGIAILIFVYGIVLFIGSLQGSASFTTPISFKPAETNVEQWATVHDVSGLMPLLKKAKAEGKPVLLDFWAKWCESCQVMDRTIFAKASIHRALQRYEMIRVDLTETNRATQALRDRYNVIGTPTFIFINSKGEVLTSLTRVGELSGADFSELIAQANTTA